MGKGHFATAFDGREIDGHAGGGLKLGANAKIEREAARAVDLDIPAEVLGQYLAAALIDLEAAADARIDRHLLHDAIGSGEEPLAERGRIKPGVEHGLGRKIEAAFDE